MKRKLAAVAVFAALALWLAASSGHRSSDHSSTASSTTRASAAVPSAKTSFLATANSICRDLGAQAAAAAPTGSDLPAYAAALGSLSSVLRRERAELGSLVPPVDGRAMFRGYLAFLDREIASAAAAQSAAARGDQPTFVQAMQGLLTGQERPSGSQPAEMVTAGKYGLTACAQ